MRLRLHAQCLEAPFNLDVWNIRARQQRQSCTAQQYRCTCRQRGCRGELRNRTGGATTQLQQQCGGAIHGGALPLRIDATFESLAGIRLQPIAPRAADDRLGSEIRNLQQDVGDIRGDGRTVSAHHPGHADRAGVIGDQQHIGREIHEPLVKQLQSFAVSRQPHLQRALDAPGVIRMHRLAGLEHDVVGHIHDRVDASQA